ncbi:MAG: ATPase [Clostridia bacterium]|nr:ATPase [Clostridia bacterium]
MILGIELGSTRIKAVLTDQQGGVLASGAFEWENDFKDGFWTYALDDALKGVRESYLALKADYEKTFGKTITKLDAIGVSAMMHGYLAFDSEDNLLVPFRTWRNTTTEKAAAELTKALGFNMPQRWSASHYYQAVLNGEEHVGKVEFLTTLAGYVHWMLTGRKVLGVGDASGMFPIKDGNYDATMLEKINALLKKKGVNKDMGALLPKVLAAGEDAGTLTQAGALLLDPTGTLEAGAAVCPPEGDAGTGMVATNAVRVRTGNVSAGTSAFVMLVLEKPLQKIYPEIDIVTTPAGAPVAMVHVNNCTSEINAWASLFAEVVSLTGGTVSKGELFERLFKVSAESDGETGKLFACNFLSGEPIAGIREGRPLFLRMPDGEMNLANFMQAQIYSALASLHLGMEILENENVGVESVCGHGGFFKTAFIGQNAMSAALGAPVTVMQTAGEGGAYGIALLALYRLKNGQPLEAFLDGVFKDSEKTTVTASDQERAKFAAFMKRYKAGLKIEKTAEEAL